MFNYKLNKIERAVLCIALFAVFTILVIWIFATHFQTEIRTIVDFEFYTNLNQWRSENLLWHVGYGILSFVLSLVVSLGSAKSKDRKENIKTLAKWLLVSHVITVVLFSLGMSFVTFRYFSDVLLILAWFHFKRLACVSGIQIIFAFLITFFPKK